MQSKANTLLLSFQIALSLVICLISAEYIPFVPYTAACFTALLCLQGGVGESWKSGKTRIIITLVGCLMGALVVFLKSLMDQAVISYVLIGLGAMGTIMAITKLKLPLIQARIGTISYLLVITVMEGHEKYTYALTRVLGTVYGLAVTLAVMVVFNLVPKKGDNGDPKGELQVDR